MSRNRKQLGSRLVDSCLSFLLESSLSPFRDLSLARAELRSIATLGAWRPTSFSRQPLPFCVLCALWLAWAKLRSIATLGAWGLTSCFLLSSSAFASAKTPAVADPSAFKDFSRYQAIIDRKPFGEPPPVVIAPPAPVPISPVVASFFSTAKLVLISTRGSEVSRVTITASEPGKPPKSYSLQVGETEEGVTLVSADYDSESVMVSKDGSEPQCLSMGTKKTGAAPAGGRVGAGGPAAFAAAAAAANARAPMIQVDGKPALSYLQRRKMAQDAADERLRKAAEEQAKIPPAELEKHLNNYQMDLIRAGGEKGPPLPIPLTEDMDNQLVTEGVLPPREAAAPAAPQ